ncbi:MAG TPA: hypothetical protein V6C50_07815 [Crinalium sp.]
MQQTPVIAGMKPGDDRTCHEAEWFGHIFRHPALVASLESAMPTIV